jgi:hypothetical protein
VRYRNSLDELYTLGFGEGGFLVGRLLKHSDEAVSYSDETLQAIANIGDDLAAGGITLGDDAVKGLGRLTDALPEGQANRILNGLCPGGVAQITPHKAAGLASPLRQSLVCDPNLLKKVLSNVHDWDEAAIDGFKELSKAGVNDKALNDILVKYVDDVPTSNQVLAIFGANPAKSAELLGKYGDDAIEMTGRYGDDGFEALSKYEDEAIKLLNEYGDESTELGFFLNKVKNVDFEKLRDISLAQAFNLHRVSQGGVTNGNKISLHIAGRLADTEAEKVVRKTAAWEFESLRDGYIKWGVPYPPELEKTIKEVSERYPHVSEEDIITLWTQMDVGRKHGIDWYQVKISSGWREVDVFIPINEWEKLGKEAQKAIRKEIGSAFNITNIEEGVDFYQLLPKAGEEWKVIVTGIDPKTRVPSGTVDFLSGGTIEHNLLGGL